MSDNRCIDGAAHYAGCACHETEWAARLSDAEDEIARVSACHKTELERADQAEARLRHTRRNLLALKQILAAVVLQAGPVRVPRCYLAGIVIQVNETTDIAADEVVYSASIPLVEKP